MCLLPIYFYFVASSNENYEVETIGLPHCLPFCYSLPWEHLLFLGCSVSLFWCPTHFYPGPAFLLLYFLGPISKTSPLYCSFLEIMVDRVMDVHILLPETCKHVTLYTNMDFADVVKDCEMERLSWPTWIGSV